MGAGVSMVRAGASATGETEVTASGAITGFSADVSKETAGIYARASEMRVGASLSIFATALGISAVA